jgi:hypothetical protein
MTLTQLFFAAMLIILLTSINSKKKKKEEAEKNKREQDIYKPLAKPQSTPQAPDVSKSIHKKRAERMEIHQSAKVEVPAAIKDSKTSLDNRPNKDQSKITINNAEEARKAIIYSEIINRKY